MTQRPYLSLLRLPQIDSAYRADLGKRSRPGLYQCSNGVCRHQFTVTTRTPLHSTKLPLQTWLTGLWLILQSDKGISSIRLGEALGISQQAAWRMGHTLRLLVARNDPFAGTIEIDQFYFGTTPAWMRIDHGWDGVGKASLTLGLKCLPLAPLPERPMPRLSTISQKQNRTGSSVIR